MGYSFPFFAAFLCVWSSTSRADAPRDLDRWGFCDARDRGWKLSLHLPLAPHSAHRLDVNDSSTYADACIKKNISVSNIQSIRSSITPKKSINHFTDRSRGDIINNEYTPLLINHTWLNHDLHACIKDHPCMHALVDRSCIHVWQAYEKKNELKYSKR